MNGYELFQGEKYDMEKYIDEIKSSSDPKGDIIIK